MTLLGELLTRRRAAASRARGGLQGWQLAQQGVVAVVVVGGEEGVRGLQKDVLSQDSFSNGSFSVQQAQPGNQLALFDLCGGRWGRMSSVSRYEQRGVVDQVWSKPPVAAQRCAETPATCPSTRSSGICEAHAAPNHGLHASSVWR